MIEEEKITYTTILHQVRKELGISVNEFGIGDYIFKMGGGEKSREIGGWVYASRKAIGESLGISRITVIRGIKKLVDKNLLEINPQTKFLRTTGKWFSEVVLQKQKIKPKRYQVSK